MRGVCSVEGCDRPHEGLGYCRMHYQRYKRWGDPLQVGDPNGPSPEERFWAKVDKRGPDECWPWLAQLNTCGYGSIRDEGRPRGAHRVAYELFVGAVPDGFEIDHLCHTRDESCSGGDSCPHRRCVNPAHLEAVPPRVNTLRGRGPGGLNARKTHCKWGHEFTEDNTYVWPRTGWRQCRTCWSERLERQTTSLFGPGRPHQPVERREWVPCESQEVWMCHVYGHLHAPGDEDLCVYCSEAN